MTVKEFIETRREGASKIAQEAANKGGLAKLTEWHFMAKVVCYSVLLAKKDLSVDYLRIRQSEVEALEMQATNMDEFQKLTGRLEVYGEIVLFMEHPDEVLASLK
jgi:hypothetical protein